MILLSLTIVSFAYRGPLSLKISHAQNYARDVVSPIQRGVQSMVNPISNSIIGASNYNQIASQNKALQRQVKVLQKQLKSNIDAQTRLSEITALENLPYAQSMPIVVAQVINSSMSNYSQTIELDKGTTSGVGVGMSVVTPQGLVGRVISAGSSTCVVLLITDPSNTISVTLYFNNGKPINSSTPPSSATPTTTVASNGTTQPTTTQSTATQTSQPASSSPSSTTAQAAPQNNVTQIFALANGQSGSNHLSLSFVPPTANPGNGQFIFTASLNGGDYPPGIPVGFISDVTIKPGNLQGSINIAPFVSFTNLNYVDVLQWLPAP